MNLIGYFTKLIGKYFQNFFKLKIDHKKNSSTYNQLF